MLKDIAAMAASSSIDLRISVFVTCLCDPDAIPKIPKLQVILQRPCVPQILQDMLAPDACSLLDTESNIDKHISAAEDASSEGTHTSALADGGLAVCASGPESLMREVQNAVAKLSLTRGVRDIALHAESFCL